MLQTLSIPASRDKSIVCVTTKAVTAMWQTGSTMTKAEEQYEKDSEAGVLSEFETCSLCLALMRDDELTDTHAGRLCKDCVDTVGTEAERNMVRGR
jgi:hypothetical protein